MNLKIIATCCILFVGSSAYGMGWMKRAIGKQIGDVGTEAIKTMVTSKEAKEALAKAENKSKEYAEQAEQKGKDLLKEVEDKIKTEAKEANKLMKDGMEEASKEFGKNILDPLSEKATKFKDGTLRDANAFVKKGALYVVGAAASIFSLWYGYKLLWNRIENALKKPSIPLKTMESSVWNRIKNLFSSSQVFTPRTLFFASELKDRLQGVIHRALDIACQIKAGDATATFSNLLLWGPAGTGKTTYARQLVQELACGGHMDYILLDGVFFTASKVETAVKKVDTLFEKIEKNGKPVVLFIDGAEFLLSKHKNNDITAESYQVMARFLHYTKERSNKCMIIFATRPLALHEEVQGIIGDSVEIVLPDTQEIIAMLKHYRDTLLINNPKNSVTLIESAQQTLTDESLTILAQELKGRSGRDIEDIVKAIKGNALAHDNLVSTAVVKAAIEQTTQKYRDFKNKLSAAPAAA